MKRVDHRQHLRLLARYVASALGAYLEVHDRIFHQPSTIRSFVENVLGKGVTIADLLAEAEGLLPKLDAVEDALSGYRAEHARDLEPGSLRYLDLLESYVSALRDTVEALIRRQRLLAEGGRRNPLTRPALQQTERDYQHAVARYKIAGLELNTEATVIFD